MLTFTASVSVPCSPRKRTSNTSRARKDDARSLRFFCTTGPPIGYWTNLPVPSNWELHGFGTLSYHKDPTNAWTRKGGTNSISPCPRRGRVSVVFLSLRA